MVAVCLSFKSYKFIFSSVIDVFKISGLVACWAMTLVFYFSHEILVKATAVMVPFALRGFEGKILRSQITGVPSKVND